MAFTIVLVLVKNSFKRILLLNILMSADNSVLFIDVGVGMNFKSLLNTPISCLVNWYVERFTTMSV